MKLFTKYKKIISILLILFAAIIPLLIEKFFYSLEPFSPYRCIIIFCALEIFILALLIGIKKSLEFLFKYRFHIATLLFSILVLFGIHGSSIGFFNCLVQCNNPVSEGDSIIGHKRGIRGDEYGVSTLNILSQEFNDYKDYNDNVMGYGSNVDLFPKLPTRSIYSITKPSFYGFYFLPVENAFAFFWWLPIFLLFLSSFEFFRLLTKDKRYLSLAGAILITFSPVSTWWSNYDILYSGFLVILMFNKFLNAKTIKHKIIFSILIAFFGAVYIQCLYPAWLVSYGYMFLGLVIWQLYDNKGKYKLKDILLLLAIVIPIILIIFIPQFIVAKNEVDLTLSTKYPSGRLETGPYGHEKLFFYFISLLMPYLRNIPNASETSQFLSFFPIPLLLSVYFIIKNKKDKKKDIFLWIFVIISIFLSLWNFIALPEFFVKLTLLSYSAPNRSQVTVGCICVILLIYLIANYKDKFKSNYIPIIGSLLFTALATYMTIKYLPGMMSKKTILLTAIIYICANYLIISNHKKLSLHISTLLIIMGLISGITVHPIVKGLDVIFDKPLSKEIQKIVKKDDDALWITASTNIMYMGDYALANGAKILNSTNYYPNENLWKKLDKKQNNEEVWNRFAHVIIDITDEKTEMSTPYSDQVLLKLQQNDLCKLNIKYIISNNDTVNTLSNDIVSIDKIYAEDEVYIYQATCTKK